VPTVGLRIGRAVDLLALDLNDPAQPPATIHVLVDGMQLVVLAVPVALALGEVSSGSGGHGQQSTHETRA
jgi:hypothetical protein